MALYPFVTQTRIVGTKMRKFVDSHFYRDAEPEADAPEGQTSRAVDVFVNRPNRPPECSYEELASPLQLAVNMKSLVDGSFVNHVAILFIYLFEYTCESRLPAQSRQLIMIEFSRTLFFSKGTV